MMMMMMMTRTMRQGQKSDNQITTCKHVLMSRLTTHATVSIKERKLDLYSASEPLRYGSPSCYTANSPYLDGATILVIAAI